MGSGMGRGPHSCAGGSEACSETVRSLRPWLPPRPPALATARCRCARPCPPPSPARAQPPSPPPSLLAPLPHELPDALLEPRPFLLIARPLRRREGPPPPRVLLTVPLLQTHPRFLALLGEPLY